jgi:hypothetical protein
MIGWLWNLLTGRSRREAEMWASTKTFTDVCELTAQWLEGRIASQPGYCGPVDVDQAPHLKSALIALNRAKFLTNDSQEGFDGEGWGGRYWIQLAAVTGFAEDDTLDWLERVLSGTRFQMIVHPCKTSFWGTTGQGTTVTWADGDSCTVYGRQITANALGGVEFYQDCSDEAIAAICSAWQVTIYDPDAGLNDLWPVLLKAAS